MKKFLSLILSIVMILSLSSTVFAAENTEYQEYTNLVDIGVLGDDITFEYWQALKTRESQLAKILEDCEEFSLVYDSSRAATSYSMQAGDVLITNGTISSGLTGHSGMAISSYSILHIAGPGKNPETTTLSKWITHYNAEGWTKIYRHSDSTVAKKAANWAEATYKDSDAEYVINMDLTSTDKTYCSKLVWQAYYYGPDTHCANGPTVGVRLPYDLPSTIHDLSLVQTYEKTS